jgi:hypothetical protein
MMMTKAEQMMIKHPRMTTKHQRMMAATVMIESKVNIQFFISPVEILYIYIFFGPLATLYLVL